MPQGDRSRRTNQDSQPRKAIDSFIDMLPHNASSGASRKFKIGSIVVLAVAAIIATFFGEIAPFPLMPWKAKQEDKAAEAVDESKPAVKWSIEPGVPNNPGTAWELDRELTVKEEEQLRGTGGDLEKVWRFFKHRGGRRVGLTSQMVRVVVDSPRTDEVSITDLSAKPVHCWKSDARTVAAMNDGGYDAWEKILFDFDRNKAADGWYAALDGEGGVGGEITPYEKVIVVGGNETPSHLKVRAERGAEGENCRWQMRVKYNVGADKTETSIVKDKDLVFRYASSEAPDKWSVRAFKSTSKDSAE